MDLRKRLGLKLLCAIFFWQVFFSAGWIALAPASPTDEEAASGSVLQNFFLGGKPENVLPMDIKIRGIRLEIEEKGFAAVYIQFAFNSATILPESRQEIESVHALLEEEPAWCLRVIGHTDTTGDPAYNLDLSRRRAASVKQALLDLDIADERLTVEGLGGAQPVADNKTEKGRAQNRRVELFKIDCP